MFPFKEIFRGNIARYFLERIWVWFIRKENIY